MDLPSDADLRAAWRALSGSAVTSGWRSIAVSEVRNMLAARRFPGNEEALLFGFRSIRVPPNDLLPHSRGFSVSQADLGEQGGGGVWVALWRQQAGSLDMFTRIVIDAICVLQDHARGSDEVRLAALLGRLRAWQAFMQVDRKGLSDDAETGLFGEIVILEALVNLTVPPDIAVESWHGPLRATHDFVSGNGAIEVKATLAADSFPCIISSLEQLDDSLCQPLFMAGVRLVTNSSGATLPEFIAKMRSALSLHPHAARLFEDRLLHAGYSDVDKERYVRHLQCAEFRLLAVTGEFPRLTVSSVPAGIMRATYELDLDRIRTDRLSLRDVATQLGYLQG